MSAFIPTPVRRRQIRAVLPLLFLFSTVSCATMPTGETRGPCDVSVERTEAEGSVATRRVLTNADVMDMVAKGVEEEEMIELITGCEADFDVSPGELLSLSRGGASEAVIRAMVAVARGS